jgi:hypothetical protein
MRAKYHFSAVLSAIGLAVGAFGFGVAPANPYQLAHAPT